MLLLLALFLVPQKAAADDFKSWYLFDSYWKNDGGYVSFVVTYFDTDGYEEGFTCDGGLSIQASKDNGNNWISIFQIRANEDGNIDVENYWNGTLRESTWQDGYRKKLRVGWNLPLDWRNCNIKFKCFGWWSEDDGDKIDYKNDVIFGPYANGYTFTVRSISWNGDLGISPDGTLTVPYSFGSSAETDGHTRICTNIDGSWASKISYVTPASNYAAGSYSFNLSDLGKNLRSDNFRIQPYHEYPHENDLNGGTAYTKSMASEKWFYKMPLATLNTPVFSQLNRTVSLSWTADNTNYGNGRWAIYRNDQFVATVSQGTYSYTDQNPSDNTGSAFAYESNPKYSIYYVANGWDAETKVSLLKSNEVTVNTTRTMPISNLSALSEDNRIVFTWTSDGYPLNWGHVFKIYVNDETSPIYTITPANQQTSYQWEHRTTDQHTERQNFMDGNIPYTEEPLNACAPHNYRIDAVIGSTVVTVLFHRSHEGCLPWHGETAVARQPARLHRGQDLYRGAPPRREERRELDDAQPHVEHRGVPDVHRRHAAAGRLLRLPRDGGGQVS